MNLQFHEAANIYPLMSGDDFDELVSDIREHGLRVPVQLLDGKIIDGRNRYRACLLVPGSLRTEVVATDNPVALVVSLNEKRRHLTPSQKSMCAARAKKELEKQAKERQRLSEGRGQKGPVILPDLKGDARDKAGELFGVSGKYVDHATRVIENGIPELAKAVDDGRMAVSTAAILATEPEHTQREAIADPKRNRVYKKNNGQANVSSGNIGKPEVKVSASSAMSFAQMAILQLQRIAADDPKRKEAFRKVSNWIERNSNA